MLCDSRAFDALLCIPWYQVIGIQDHQLEDRHGSDLLSHMESSIINDELPAHVGLGYNDAMVMTEIWRDTVNVCRDLALKEQEWA